MSGVEFFGSQAWLDLDEEGGPNSKSPGRGVGGGGGGGERSDGDRDERMGVTEGGGGRGVTERDQILHI